MKNLGKKIAAVILAAATVLGTCVMASAATKTSSKNYDVSVSDKKIVFTRSGKKATYNMKTTDVKLVIDEDDDLLVCFTDSKSKYKGISLGSQRTVNVGGTMNTLTLNSSLGSKITVNVTDTADVKTMTITSKGAVNISGDVTTLNVNGASQVTVEKGANISLAKVTSSTATLEAKSGSSVKKVNAVKKSNVTGSGIKSTTTSKSSSDDDDDDEDDDDSDKIKTRFHIDDIYVQVDDFDGDIYLDDRDLREKLENNVYAYYRKNGDEYDIDGTLKFTSSKKIWDEDDDEKSKTISVRFKFTPKKSSSYTTETESIDIHLEY